MGTIIDIILVLIFISAFIIMSKKGFIKAIYSLSSGVITLLLIALFLTPMTQALGNTKLGTEIEKSVNTFLTQNMQNPGEDLSPLIKDGLASSGIDAVSEQVGSTISQTVLKIVTIVILFILIRILVGLLFFVLEAIFKFPVLSQANRLAGGIAGLVNVLLAVYIICAVLSLNFEWTNNLRGIIDQTKILKYFYVNNYMISLFM